MAKHNKHLGSSLDDLLEETGELAEVNAVAIKRVIAWEIMQHVLLEKCYVSSFPKSTGRT